MSKVFIISGPSGCGKDSIIQGLKKQGYKFKELTTTTTRPMRQGETQGHPYWFIEKKEFENLIKEDKLVEWAKVYGNYYGLRKKDIEGALNDLNDSRPIILKVDPQGARTYKKKFPDIQVIFVVPADIKNLEKRLKDRGQDSQEAIEKRLEQAKAEMANLSFWDKVIINKQGELDKAIEQVSQIIWGTVP